MATRATRSSRMLIVTDEDDKFEFPVPPKARKSTVSNEERIKTMAAILRMDRWRAHWCTILGWILFSLGLSSVILFIVMLGIYLHFRPVLPDVRVLQMTYLYFIVSPYNQSVLIAQQQSGTGNYYAAEVAYKLVYTVSFENPNKRVTVEVDFTDAEVYYNGFFTGKTRTASWTQPPTSSSVMNIIVTVSKLQLRKNVAFTIVSDLSKASVTGVVDLNMRARMKTFSRIRSPVFWIKARCSQKVVHGHVIENKCTKRGA